MVEHQTLVLRVPESKSDLGPGVTVSSPSSQWVPDLKELGQVIGGLGEKEEEEMGTTTHMQSPRYSGSLQPAGYETFTLRNLTDLGKLEIGKLIDFFVEKL